MQPTFKKWGTLPGSTSVPFSMEEYSQLLLWDEFAEAAATVDYLVESPSGEMVTLSQKCYHQPAMAVLQSGRPLKAWRAHMRQRCAELGAKHGMLAKDVIERVQSYASEHPEHVALVWRWMLGEDFWSEVRKKAMEPAQRTHPSRNIALFQPQPQAHPQPKAQPQRQPGAQGGDQSRVQAKEQTRLQAGAHIQPSASPHARPESQWQLTALPGATAVKSTGSANGNHVADEKGEKNKYKVGAIGNSAVKGNAAQLQPPIQPNRDYLSHPHEVPVWRTAGFGGADKHVSVAERLLRIEEHINVSYTHLVAHQQQRLQAHRAAAEKQRREDRSSLWGYIVLVLLLATFLLGGMCILSQGPRPPPMASPPIPAHPPQLASLPQLGTASSWDIGAGIAGDHAHQQPWAEPAAATQAPADATAVEDKVAASITAVDEKSAINATAVEGVATVSQEVAVEATSASAMVAQTLSGAAQPAATETPAAAAAPNSSQRMPFARHEDTAVAVEAAATSTHTTAGAFAEIAAAASASLAPAIESSAASLMVVPGIDAPESDDVRAASATAQLYVDNVKVTSPAAAPGPGSAGTAGSDESRPQLPLTSTAVAPYELHDIVAVMEADSHAPADGAASNDITAAEGGGPSYFLASPGIASGDSESGSPATASDSAAAESGMCPEAAHEAEEMDRHDALAADGQQLGMGTMLTHIQTAHVTLHGSTTTLGTSPGDRGEDGLSGSTAADTEQVVAAEDLDVHKGAELADSFATSVAEGSDLANHVAPSDAELSESTCWPSAQSAAAVEAAADVDTAESSMPAADVSEAAEDAATSAQAGSLHEEQPAQQDAQPAKHDAEPAESVAEHCPTVAPTAAAESGPTVDVANEDVAAPGSVEMLQDTLHATSAADVHSITEQHITNAAAAAEMSQSTSDLDPDSSGGPGIAAETGEDWSSTCVVMGSHGAFDSTLLLGTHESTLPGDATEATATLSTPEFTDTVDQAEEALLPASQSTSLTIKSAKQGSSAAPACNFASHALVALQQSATIGLGEMPPMAGQGDAVYGLAQGQAAVEQHSQHAAAAAAAPTEVVTADMDDLLLPTAVHSDQHEQAGAVAAAAVVPDALQSHAAQKAEGSIDSAAGTGASVATDPAAEPLVVAAPDTSMDAGGIGAVSATSVEPAQSQLIANGVPWADAQQHHQMTTAAAVEPGDAPVTFWQGSDSSSHTGDTVFSGSGIAELSIPTDTAHEAAAAAQIEEGQAVDGQEYVLTVPAFAMAPAEVDTLATSPEDVSDVVEVSPAASGLDQPAAAEDLNAALGAELAAIFALLGAEQADTFTGPASMSTEATEAEHRTDVVTKDGSVLAVLLENDAEVIASSLAASQPGWAAEAAAAAAAATAAELAASPLDSDPSEMHAEHLCVQTTQAAAAAAATHEGALSLATEGVPGAADDAAAEPQVSGFLPAEPAQVLSQHHAAVALTAEAQVQPTAAESPTVEVAASAAADFQDSFRALKRDSDADLPAVIQQHDASAAAAAWGVQSAPPASTNSLAGDSVKLVGDHAARAFCSVELITLGEIFDPMVLLGSAESAVTGGTPGAAATSLPGVRPANGDYWRGPPLMRPSFTAITAKQRSSIAPACTLACCASVPLQQPAIDSLSRLSHMAGRCNAQLRPNMACQLSALGRHRLDGGVLMFACGGGGPVSTMPCQWVPHLKDFCAGQDGQQAVVQYGVAAAYMISAADAVIIDPVLCSTPMAGLYDIQALCRCSSKLTNICSGLCSACVNCLFVPDMVAMVTALCPINAVPALMPSSGLLSAAQSNVWPLNKDKDVLLALRMVQPCQCCAATTPVEVQSGTIMLLPGRPATQTTPVHATAAKQVSHPVLGGPGLRCAMMLQAHLVRQLIDTAAEQTKLAVDSNMAHSRALSSILVPPFDFGYRVITAPARHANAGAGSLHALAQAVAHVDTPSAMIAGQADADSKQAFDVRHFEDEEQFGCAPLPDSPCALEAQLAVLQDTVLQLCQRLDDKALLSTCLTAEIALQQLGTHLEVHQT